MSGAFFFFSNFLVGLVVALALRRWKLGCLAVLPLCIAAVVRVVEWQSENADKLTSTSSLDYVLGFLFTGLAGVVGLTIGRGLRDLWSSLRK